jgi:hypothetical protein
VTAETTELGPRTLTIMEVAHAISQLRSILFERPDDAELRAELEHAEEHLMEALAWLERVGGTTVLISDLEAA